MLNNMEKALQAYAEYLQANYDRWSYSHTMDRHLVVEFDKGNKFIKVIVGHMTNGVVYRDWETLIIS